MCLLAKAPLEELPSRRPLSIKSVPPLPPHHPIAPLAPVEHPPVGVANTISKVLSAQLYLSQLYLRIHLSRVASSGKLDPNELIPAYLRIKHTPF